MKPAFEISFDPHTPLPRLEEAVLAFWQTEHIFQKSVEKNKNRPTFSFYDGPPFATGLPHYGHILAMTLKDTVTRYKTMRGYYVPRRNGWDCHGLPVEYELEKELGLKGRRDIVEKVGIEAFNRKAREIVLRYSDQWLATIERLGRWTDTESAYRSMDSSYIESVWWVFRQLWDKKFVYEGHKSMPYCPRCGTPLSNFETNLGYRDNVSDPSVYVKFKIKNPPSGAKDPKLAAFEGVSLLIWTTTPWTLPANAALAVKPEATYVLAELSDGSKVFVEKSRVRALVKGELKGKLTVASKAQTFKGMRLVGLRYEPLFNFFQPKDKNKAWFVGEADFVTLEEGTGIVHIAPAYGADDFDFGKEHGLPVFRCLREDGTVVDELPWKRQWFKDADKEILQALKEQGSLASDPTATISHTYPFCWRCETPLYYTASSSWFIAVSKIKTRLVALNQTIHWIPEHLRDGRFGRWLQEARDWAVSRRRFWGAPLPIWKCSADHKEPIYECIGSIAELKKKSRDPGSVPNDLHRPAIDNIIINCPHCGGDMYRVEEVFDCWFESGSMPYAQWHYPFQNKLQFEQSFPADFIAEGLDQTRGWFYTLHVIGAILQDSVTYKNVVVNGLVLAEDGHKLSKRLRNYVEPQQLFDSTGADAVRLFLLGSTTLGEDYRFSDKAVRDMLQSTLRPLWNALVFLKDFYHPLQKAPLQPHNRLLDEWIVSRLHKLVIKMTGHFDRYHLDAGTRLIRPFIDDLTNWYVRRSRKRVDPGFGTTLATVLRTLSGVLAPITPFIAEVLYQATKTPGLPESVHLTTWPGGNTNLVNQPLTTQMQAVRQAVSMGLGQRFEAGVKVRQPLGRALVHGFDIPASLAPLIRDELNVQSVVIEKGKHTDVRLDMTITDELRTEGIVREAIRAVQEGRRRAGVKPSEELAHLTLTVPAQAYAIVGDASKKIAKATRIRSLEIIAGEGFETAQKAPSPEK